MKYDVSAWRERPEVGRPVGGGVQADVQASGDGREKSEPVGRDHALSAPARAKKAHAPLTRTLNPISRKFYRRDMRTHVL